MALGNPLLPPLSMAISDSNGMLTSFWLNWFNQLYQIYSANLQIAQSIPNNSTAGIALLQLKPGDIVFNSTTSQWQGWDGTQLVTFTTVP